MRYNYFLPIFILLFNIIIAQNTDYSSLLIPENLKENANSIIRNQTITINIISQKSMIVKTSKVITVLNSKGVSNVDAREYYSRSEKKLEKVILKTKVWQMVFQFLLMAGFFF